MNKTCFTAPRSRITLIAYLVLAGAFCASLMGQEVKRDNDWSFSVDKDSGALSAIGTAGQQWLSSSSTFRVADEVTGKDYTLSVKHVSTNNADETILCELTGDGIEGAYYYKTTKDAVKVTFEIVNRTQADMGATLKWTLPLLMSGRTIFLAQEANLLPFDELDAPWKAKASISLAFPMWTAFDDKGGMSIVADLSEHRPEEFFEIFPDGQLEVTAINRWLPRDKPVRISYYIVLHSGDPRAALRWFRDHHRDMFRVSFPKALEQEGVFATWRPVPDEELDDYARQGMKWWEVHGTFPFYGQYVSEKEPYHWEGGCRLGHLKKAEQPGEDLSELGEPTQTHEQVRDFIRRLHRVGAYAYMYWNQNDCYYKLAEEKWPEAIARKESGEPYHVSLYNIHLLSTDPPNSWTEHILVELNKIIETYPELDGIFNDQICYYYYDYARHDNITMLRGRRVYNNRHSYPVMLKKVGDLLHRKGLVLWGNGSHMIELAQYVDGIMIEGWREGGLEGRQYTGLLGKPLVLVCGKGYARRLEDLQRCLILGLQPYVVQWKDKADRDRQLQLMDAYLPYVDMLRGKQWVLADNALVVPKEIDGNVFVNPAGQGIVPIVSFDTRRDGELSEQFFQPVKVCFEQNQYRGCYLTAPGRPGKYKLSCNHVENSYDVVIPVHESTSVLVFESDGVHLSLAADSMLAIPGRPHTVKAVVDNLTSNVVNGALVLETPQGKVEKECSIPRNTSATVTATIEPGPDTTGEQIPVKLAFTEKQIDLREEAVILVRSPVAVRMTVPAFVKAGESVTATLHVSNLTDTELSREVTIAMNDAPCERVRVRIPPKSAVTKEVSLTIPAPGKAVLSATVDENQSKLNVEVIGTALRTKADLHNILRAWLVMKVNRSSGDNHLILNGTEVAGLGGTSIKGELWKERRLEIPVVDYSLLQVTNCVSLVNTNANQGIAFEDNYVIKDLHLELLMADGIRIVSDGSGIIRSSDNNTKNVELGFEVESKAANLPVLAPENIVSAELSMLYAFHENEKEETAPFLLNGVAIDTLKGSGKSGWNEMRVNLEPDALKKLGWANHLFFPADTTPKCIRVKDVALKIVLKDGVVLEGARPAMCRKYRSWQDVSVRLEVKQHPVTK